MLKWLPLIDRELCTGCGKCIDACGPQCLVLRDGCALLLDPERCGSEEHCLPPCPEKAIYMRWLQHEGSRKRGRWQD